MKHLFFLTLTSCLLATASLAQGSLLDEMSSPTSDSAAVESMPFPSSFETVRLVNGHSTEMPGKRAMQFMITHRFGELGGGPHELFGLDQANMRFGFDVGITDRIAVGLGRSNIKKTYDTHLKIKFLQQSEKMPVSLVWMSVMSARANRWDIAGHPNNRFTHRLSYTHQALISHRASGFLSLQLMPGMVHRNLSPLGEENDVFFCGLGASVKLNSRNAINVEYYPFIANKPGGSVPSFAVGWDLETGGHVFQITLANSRAMTENLFLTESTGKILDGGIHLGFNLMRFFEL